MIYRGNKLKEISFPLGGIGTGCLGLAGNGALLDWEIFNRPNKGSKNGYSCFAVKALFPDGKSVTKILQGDHIKDFSGQYEKTFGHRGFGYGPAVGTFAGFPHFRNVKFDGKFPITTLTFKDDDFPATVELLAFNPLIPLDADNSSIPAAFFQIKIKSSCDHVKYTVVFSVSNPFTESVNRKLTSDTYTAIQMTSANKSVSEKDYGDLTIAVDAPDGLYQEYWYRGRMQDDITTFWNNLTEGNFMNRHYETAGKKDTCSVGASAVISSGQNKCFRFILSWNVPNNYNDWAPCKSDITWKNYYATLFRDSTESCFYCSIISKSEVLCMHEECLICNAQLEYLNQDEWMECAVCHKKEQSKTRCVNGHYVCSDCHTQGMDSIFGLCLSETSCDPIAVLEKMMSMPFCHMHGPEHHVMVGAALVTAFKNAGGDVDLPKALQEIYQRGKAVPGGACGFWGACGAGVSAGQFMSVVTASTPLTEEPWSLSNRMTAKALESIGKHGGPRCCKRDSYLAILAAIDFAAEHLKVQMKKATPVCERSRQNNQCIGTRCPFWGGNA